MKILLSEIDETRLPLTKAEFTKIMENYNDKSDYNVSTKCTYNLKNLINSMVLI